MRAEALAALLLAFIAVSLIPQTSGSQPLQAISLSPSDDAEVRELSPERNHGSSAVMWVRSAPGRDRRAFLKFDLSSLPPNAVIVEARLNLYCQVAAGADLLVQARAVRDDGWDERTITWSNQPPHGEVLDVVRIARCHSRRWYSWDVTDFVRAEFSGDGVVSLCLRAAEEDVRGSDGFRSKEHGVASTRPYLEVKYILRAYAVAVSISPSSQAAPPGSTLSYVVTIANLGSVEDTYSLAVTDDAGWAPRLSESSLTIPAGGEATVMLSMRIPDDAAGGEEDNVTVVALGTGASGSASCIARAEVVRSVGVSILPSEASGAPGETLSYEVVVRNFGNVDDVYALVATDALGWSLSLEGATLAVPRGEGREAALLVTIPVDVASSVADEIEVRATSLENSEVSSSATCEARAIVVRGVGLEISPSYQTGAPGEELDFAVRLTNLGNVEDTYTLSARDDAGWSPVVSPTTLTLAVGESSVATLRVVMPDNWLGCTEDNITVRAVGTCVENSATCVAHLAVVRGVEVSVSPSYQSGLPGEVLTYAVVVKNVGNVPENFGLRASDGENWTLAISPAWLFLSPGESGTATLSVALPEFVVDYVEDDITVTATSLEDPTVSASDSCVAHPVLRRVEVSISPGDQAGRPGEVLSYAVTVKNAGELEENISLAASDELGWPLGLDDAWLLLSPGEDGETTLRVIIPIDARGGAEDRVTVAAVPVGYPPGGASEACVARALPIHVVEVSISPSHQGGLPGATLTYGVSVANKGNVADNFSLEASDELGWVLELSPATLEVPAGESGRATLLVAIPAGASPCTRNEVKVIASGTWAENSASCIASVGPVPPRPLEPPDGSLIKDRRPTFRWENSYAADSYELWVDDDPSFSSPLILQNIAENSFSPALELSDGSYWWRVRAYKCGEVSEFSAVWTFAVDATPPSSSVDAISPYWRNSSPLTIGATAMDAGGVAEVGLYYRYSPDNSSWGGWTLFARDDSPPWSWSFDFPRGDGYYEFYSLALDAAGNVEAPPAGADAACGLDREAPGAPTPISPVGGSWTNDNTPTLSWSAAGDALSGVARYELQVDDDSSFGSPEISAATVATSQDIADELREGSQYWRVRAVDLAGNAGTWASGWFRVDVTPPGKPTLVMPENNAVRWELSITFAWTEPEPGVVYCIQVDDEPSFSPPHVHEDSGVVDNSYACTFASDGTYHWRVRAGDAAGNWGAWSDAFKLTIELPRLPGKPSLLSPGNGELTNDRTPAFRWVPGANADNHRLLVDDDPDFSSPIDEVTLGAADDGWTKPSPGYADGAYYWKVVAINAAGENSSDVWTFAVDATPPAAPAPVWPPDGQNLNNSSPNLDWGAVADASQPVLYRVVVSDSPEFGHENRSSGWLTSDNWRVSPPLPEGLWYWRVQAKDAAGNLSEWSAPRWFRVDLTPPPAPQLLEPADGAAATENRPRFRWAAVVDESMPVAYRLQVDNDGDFSSPEVDASWLEDNSLALELPADNYRWRVQARDNAGNVGEWSVSWSLQVLVKVVEAKVSPAAARGVSVEISPSSASAAPGQALSYAAAVRNTGEVEDSYSLTAVDTLGWRLALSEGRLEGLRPGQERKVTLSVLVPEGAAAGIEDRITVVARGTGVSASGACIARVIEVAPRAGVSVEVSPATKSGPPGAKLTFRVLVRNAGGVEDAFSLAVSGSADWSPRLKPSGLELAAGAMGSAELELEVPRGAEEGSSETFVVTATSSRDPSVAASASCTAVVGAAPLVLLIPLAAAAMLIGAAILLVSYLRYRAREAKRSRVLGSLGGP